MSIRARQGTRRPCADLRRIETAGLVYSADDIPGVLAAHQVHVPAIFLQAFFKGLIYLTSVPPYAIN